jgi:hypothetical protein
VRRQIAQPWLRGGSFDPRLDLAHEIDQINFNYFNILAGAANRTRTCDPVITNDVLYQLSYCGELEPSIDLLSRFLDGKCQKTRAHLIPGTARIGKENAGLKGFLSRPSGTENRASRRLAP